MGNYFYNPNDGELYHFGVKGMKWGVRKVRQAEADLRAKQSAYKKAKKAYSKSFNKAYGRAIGAYSPVKKHREANDARWKDADKKAAAFEKAKSDYESAKKEFNKNTTVGQKIGAAFRSDGAKKAYKAMLTIGAWSVADDVFYGGRGKEAIKTTGRLATTGVLKAMGHHDIKWYDSKGNRVG